LIEANLTLTRAPVGDRRHKLPAAQMTAVWVLGALASWGLISLLVAFVL
jgi:hypothetical protein